MAERSAAAAAAEQAAKATDRAPILVVDFGKRQKRGQVKELRKGCGPLMVHVEEIVEELVAEGTVKADAQPLVIVVREREKRQTLPWPFS